MKTKDTLPVGGLNPIPEFYESLANAPTLTRLRSLNLKVGSPYIVEFLSGQILTETFTIPFLGKYKNIPLVIGLFDTTYLGQPKVRPIFPNNQNLVVTTKDVTLGTSLYPAQVGGRFSLRVYNLDI